MTGHSLRNSTQNVLPTVPADWRIERINDIVDLRTSNVDKKSEDGQNPVMLCNYVDVYKNETITANLDFMDATATEAQIERFKLKAGDVVITKDSETADDIGIPAFVAETIPNLVCGYHLTILRPNVSLVSGRYLFYALKSVPSGYQFYLAANGVTRFGLTYQGTKNIEVAIPSTPIQHKIITFLDWKILQIDESIDKKKQLLEKLKEKRLAVITQAVTRGLNPAAPLRDSGIPWLGRVPNHWEVKKLKFVVSKVGSGVTPLGGADSYESAGIPFLRSQNIHFDGLQLDDVVFISQATHEEMSNSQVLDGDVLLNITGASLGRCYYLDKSITEANVSQHVCIIRPGASILTRYLHYLLWSDIGQLQIQLEQSGSGREGLNFIAIKNFVFPIPDTAEQKAIADYLESELKRMVGLMDNVESVIARLTEYRKALITAATTGKIDVRNVKVGPES